MAAWWPFGRRGRNASDPAAPPAADVAPPRRQPSGDTRPTGAWRQLPPLRPSAPAIELTAPVQRLADTITSSHRTSLTDDELAHARTSGGPAGTVAGLLRPRIGEHRERADGGALLLAAPEPVPGSSAVPLRRGASTTPQPGPATPMSSAPAPVATPSIGTAPAATGGIAASVPPTGGTSAAAVAVAQSATSAPPTGSQRMPAAASDLPPVTTRALPVAVPAAPSPDAVASAAPVSNPVDLPLPLPPPPTSPATSPERGGDPPAATERSPLVGHTRIVRRVGEAMRERPATMVAATDEALAAPLAVPPGVARLPVEGTPTRPRLPEPGAIPARPARPVASVAATPSGQLGEGSSGGQATLTAGHVRSDSATLTAPLVGSRRAIQRIADARSISTAPASAPASSDAPAEPPPVPVRWPGSPHRDEVPAGVQRAAESVPADLRAELEPMLDTPLADVKVHRDADTGEAARQLSAKAFTAGGEVFLPDWHGSTSGGEARSILTHELTHVAQQRRLGSALPAEDSPDGAALETEARAVADQGPPVPTRPVAAGTRAGQRLAAAQSVPPARHLPHRESSGGMRPVEIAARVQAAAAAAGIGTSPVLVHSRPAAGAPAAPTLSPAPPPATPAAAPAITPPTTASVPLAAQRLPDDVRSAQNVTTSAASSTPAETGFTGATEDPARLDELARRLYPRFRTRLRQDLLADRERSGRLFDVR